MPLSTYRLKTDSNHSSYFLLQCVPSLYFSTSPLEDAPYMQGRPYSTLIYTIRMIGLQVGRAIHLDTVILSVRTDAG